MSLRLAALEQRDRPQPEIDLDIVKRLSALPEDRALDYFWLMTREGANRLVVLLQLGQVVINRPSDWSPAAIRREHEQDGGKSFLDRRYCFVCQATKARLYFHHIVEVHHGGSNVPRNKVPLCFLCHQYLHPWLTEEPPPRHVHGFESIYEMLARWGRNAKGKDS
jgi:hypothetical protein